MAQISKVPLDKEIEVKIYRSFLDSMVNIKSPEEAQEFTHNLLTPAERIVLAKRLAIAILLAKGYNYGQISKALKVSTSTIGSVASWIKLRGTCFRKYLTDQSTLPHWSEILKYIDTILASR